MAEKKKSKLLFAAAALLFLVVLPAISWYYLTLGRDWRRAVVAELSEYGSIPPLTKTDNRGLNYNFVENSVCVVYVAPDSVLADNDGILVDVYSRLYSQFQAKENFKLIVIRPDRHPIGALLQKANTTNNPNWIELTPADTAWMSSVSNGLIQYNQKNATTPSLPAKGIVALSDTKGVIRKYYNIAEINQQKRLVEHIAILLPN